MNLARVVLVCVCVGFVPEYFFVGALFAAFVTVAWCWAVVRQLPRLGAKDRRRRFLEGLPADRPPPSAGPPEATQLRPDDSSFKEGTASEGSN